MFNFVFSLKHSEKKKKKQCSHVCIKGGKGVAGNPSGSQRVAKSGEVCGNNYIIISGNVRTHAEVTSSANVYMCDVKKQVIVGKTNVQWFNLSVNEYLQSLISHGV